MRGWKLEIGKLMNTQFLNFRFPNFQFPNPQLPCFAKTDMDFLKNTGFAVVASVLFAACGNDAQPPVSRTEKIASAYCECTAQLAELNKKVAMLAADTAAAKDMRAYFSQIQEEYQRAKDCSATIVGQFGKLKEEDFAGVEKALQGKCPDLTEQRDLLREMLGE